MFIDLGLSQIVPMLDEETGAEPRVLTASIGDPYLLLIRDDSSVWFGQIDSNCELEEMDRNDEKLHSNKWVSGCLYTDSEGHFTTSQKAADSAVILAFLVSAAGALYVSILDLCSVLLLTLPCVGLRVAQFGQAHLCCGGTGLSSPYLVNRSGNSSGNTKGEHHRNPRSGYRRHYGQVPTFDCE